MVSRSELATRLARDGASHAQAVHAVDAVLHEITAALVAGERVALTGFGTFEPVARSARTARNPRTGAAVEVAATTVARFRPGVQLREALVSGDAGAPPAGRLPEAAHPVAPAAVPMDVEPRATDEGASIGMPGTASAGSGKVDRKSLRKSRPKGKPTSSKHADSAKPAKGKKGKKLATTKASSGSATTKASSGSAKSRGAKKSSKGKH